MSGRGTLTLPNGHVQSGDFRDGQIWRGTWVDENGGVLGGESCGSLKMFIPLYCGALMLPFVRHNLRQDGALDHSMAAGTHAAGRWTCRT
jgi:hypothetical protein